jgi:O-antigen/teichoic acid export membrane protein
MITSLNKKIAHNATFQLIGKIASTLLGAAATIFIMRGLGSEQYGWYITASSFLQFVGIATDFGFTLTTTNLLSEGIFNKEKILNTTFYWRCVTALLFQAMAPLIFLLFSPNKKISEAVFITTISFFALALNQVFVGYLQAALKNYQHMIGEIIGRIVLVIGTGFVYVTGRNFIATMWVITLASIVYTIYLFFQMPPIRFETDRLVTKALYTKTWPVAISIIFNAIYLQGDRVILPFYVSQTTVGLYGGAYKILDFVVQSAALIMGIMLPLLTSNWAERNFRIFKQHFHTSIILTALILFPAVAGAIVLSTPLMRVVGGDSFVGSGKIFGWLSLAIIGICFGMIGGYTMLAVNRQKFSLIIFISNALLSLVGYFVFIPRFGVWGAVGVTIFSEWYAGISLTWFASYFSKTNLPWKQLCKIFLASFLMGLALWFLLRFNLSVILLLLSGIFFYGCAVLLLRVTSFSALRKLLLSSEH